LSKQIQEDLIEKACNLVTKHSFGNGKKEISSTFLRNLMDNAQKKKKKFFQAYVYYQMARHENTRDFCTQLLKESENKKIEDIIEFLSYIIWFARYKEKTKGKNPIL